MLGAELGNLESHVRGIHDLLADSVDLIAEDQGIFPAFSHRIEGLEAHRIDCLLDADDPVPAGTEFRYRGESAFGIFPWHAVLRSEACLVDFGRRGSRAYSAKPDRVRLEGIAGPEGRAHVVRAADIVQDQHHTALGQG